MFKEIKYYTYLQNSYQNSDNNSEIGKLCDELNTYTFISTKIMYTSLFELFTKLWLRNEFWIFISYYEELKKTKKERVFLEIKELLKSLKSELKLIKQFWWLEYYIINKNYPSIFFQIHYQDNVIIIYKNNTKNIEIIKNLGL